jgi:hypothetical protein
MISPLVTQSMILTVLNLASAVALVILAYYAVRIFVHMRLGRLEKGWRFITQGIVFMSSGFFFVAVDHSLSRTSTLYFYIDSVGAVLSLIGIVFMLFGLHSHYVVWYKKSVPAEVHEENEQVNDNERPNLH